LANISAVPNRALFATTQEVDAEDGNICKIAFSGFDDANHWIQATKASPSILVRHRYTRVSIQLDDVQQNIWLLEKDLVDKFTETRTESYHVLQHFPDLFFPYLCSHAQECTHDRISKAEIQKMVAIGTEHVGGELQCIKAGIARPMVVGQGCSYILFTKTNTRKDSLFGSGTIKRVKLALSTLNGKIYSLGVCRQDFIGKDDWGLIPNEVRLLYDLRGIQGILQIEVALEWKNKFYIISEHFNRGDLQRVFDEKEEFTEEEKLKIAYEIALGVYNLHSLKIIHRDLKPQNILVSIEGKGPDRQIKAVVGDLGSGCKMGEEKYAVIRTGTPSYLAPEKLASLLDITLTDEWVAVSTPQADIWSLGMILFSLFHPQAGTLMDFQSYEHIELRIRNLTSREINEEIETSGIDVQIQTLLTKMLRMKPTERCPAVVVCNELRGIMRSQKKKMPPETGAVDKVD
jgi:hypothetical protein